MRDLPGCAAGGRHHEDLSAVVTIRNKSNFRSVGREARLRVVGRVAGQWGGGAALDGSGPDLAEPGEGQGLAVGRERRVARQVDRASAVGIVG